MTYRGRGRRHRHRDHHPLGVQAPGEAPALRPLGIVTFVAHVLRRLTVSKPAKAVMALGLVIEVAFTAMVPLSFEYLLDTAIPDRDRGAFAVVFVALIVGVVVVALFGLWLDYLYAKGVSGMLVDLRVAMFERLQKLSSDYYAKVNTADVLEHFSSDVESVESTLSVAVPWAVLPAMNVVVSWVLIFTIDWRLALVATFVFPLCLLPPRVIGPRSTAAGYQRKEEEGAAMADVEEAIAAQSAIKAFELEESTLRRFQAKAGQLFRTTLRVGILAALLERSATVAVFLVRVLVLGFGIFLVFEGTLTVGAIVAFQGLFVTLSDSLICVMEYVPLLARATAGLQRMEELIAEEVHVREPEDPVHLPRLSGEITFEDVSFGYSEDNRILDGITLGIRAGQSVAFVGPSGSGKSSLLSLIPRYYDPVAGAVRFDGVDVREASNRSLRGQLSVVFQDVVLFNTTVRENIRMGRAEATDAEVEEAAREAEIHDIVMNMPEGYDTPVGELGHHLSGGQRQRVAIARALIRDPAILLLDEATSALDAASEAGVQATLERVGRDRTVVAVTHRLSQAVTADRIFMLDRGRLIEQGSHEELLAAGGAYAQMWSKQTAFAPSTHGQPAQVQAHQLRRVPVIQDGDDESMTALAQLFVTEHVPAGHVVYKQGDWGDRFYIIVRGVVEVTRADASGAETGRVVLHDGDHFGELALAEGGRRQESVRTRAASEFLMLRRDQLLELRGRMPQINLAPAPT
ncbi:MAG TPA: ABC transporter transmembrane domain-containing protein [Acidimicrobiales bacterium]|nr:ABC transporter transmembrane domain-containing protein [Acidimicrobiales bacterium]